MFPRAARTPLLLAAAVLAVAFTVWSVGEAQRDEVSKTMDRSEAVHDVITILLEQQSALRGYTVTRQPQFYDAYEEGEEEFEAQLDATRRLARPSEQDLLGELEDMASDWDEAADVVMDSGAREGVADADVIERQKLMDRMMGTLEKIDERVEANRAEVLVDTSKISAGLVIAISALFALGGWLAFGRRAGQRARRRRQELAQRERQTTFAHTLQFMDTEDDAHRLVKRHLESSLSPDAEVTVLRRNNSADRLEAATPVAPDSPLADNLVDAQPRSCLAVRLGAAHKGGAAGELLQCDLCGKTETELTTCSPLLVQGEVIGSVLVTHHEPLGEICADYVDDTVTQAAPVVANMRNLAIAELRAATDALTGLANRRTIQDTLRRMVAQAMRAETTLAAIAIDLDHFKQVNDRFGHDKGDDVLAAAAQTLTATLRTSDFVGRMGGEEFVVLLPDTGIEGALIAAENLRAEIERIAVPGVEQPITASFGVAVLPADALDADGLLRHADRALYAAKDRGRNRVESASSVSPQIPG